MEKNVRSSRKAPAASGDRRIATRARRARTLADATDPRTPVRRNNDDADYFEQDYSARDAQAPSGPPQFTLPSHPSIHAIDRDGEHTAAHRRPARAFLDRAMHHRGHQQSSWDEHARDGQDWSRFDDDDDDARMTTTRSRAQSVARPLALTHMQQAVEPMIEPVAVQNRVQNTYQGNARALMAVDSMPDLVAWRPPVPVRKPVYTRAIETAQHHPWSVSRSLLVIIAIVVTLLLSVTKAGEPAQPLMQFFNTQAASASAQSIADLVKPLTQGTLVDQYDSVAQYNSYWGAACSAAVLAETLTAWGVHGATIGRMIDELGNYISPYGGLLSYAGFQQVAIRHAMRAEFRENLTYSQMLYITNKLHLPLIVNVRISYGFYHFFSGGHFLVMTAGDNQGVRLVDSSLYYVHYMPLSVFNSMFTGRTVLLTPQDYIVSLPSA